MEQKVEQKVDQKVQTPKSGTPKNVLAKTNIKTAAKTNKGAKVEQTNAEKDTEVKRPQLTKLTQKAGLNFNCFP